MPDFVTREDFDWAVRKATAKKKQDFSKVEFFPYEEGLCVQCMHIGAYDDEPVTVDAMHRFMEEQGYTLDIHRLPLRHKTLKTRAIGKSRHSYYLKLKIAIINIQQ